MELIIKNKREIYALALLTAITVFMVVFFTTPFILQSVHGLKPGDEGWVHHGGAGTGVPDNTPFQDFMVNGCLTAPWIQGDPKVVFDTKGLEELGLFYYDPNYCFDVAKNTPGYIIDKIETYTMKDSSGYYDEEHMKITLVKKP